MADAVRGPAVNRPSAFATEERRAVHSWSRISSAGHNVLLEAMQILSPMSRDLSNTEDLVTFLQELREEGHKPTVLHSKDVYGYRSCMSRPLTEDMLKPPKKNPRPTAKRRRRRPLTKKKRRPLTKKKEVHPSWCIPKRNNPRIQGIRPAELQQDAHSDHRGVAGVAGAALPKTHQHRHTTWDSEVPPAVFSQQQHPPTLSGIPSQPSQNGGGAPTTAVALFSQKSLSCPIRLGGALIGDSAWRGNGVHQPHKGPKETNRSPNNPAGQRTSWKDRSSLRWKVIKVDDSRSVSEARRKAQKITQVNLSPVIQIQPFVV
ncbi:uncharacterized protein ACN63O_020513 [Diretmus argenteus]